jgi:hypothetical protein
LPSAAERHSSAFLVLRAAGLPLFSQHQQCRRLRQGLLFALQLLFEGLDLSLILSVEFFEILLSAIVRTGFALALSASGTLAMAR